MFTSKSGELSWDLSLQLVCFCRRVTFTHDKVVVKILFKHPFNTSVSRKSTRVENLKHLAKSPVWEIL